MASDGTACAADLAARATDATQDHSVAADLSRREPSPEAETETASDDEEPDAAAHVPPKPPPAPAVVVVRPRTEPPSTAAAAATGAAAPRYAVKKVSHATPMSTTERNVKSVPEPPRERLPHDALFRADGSIDIDRLRRFFADEGRLQLADAHAIVAAATNVLHAEPTVLMLPVPITSLC